MSRILRVFPRRTNATPTDDLAVIGYPDMFSAEIHPAEIRVSVTFTHDRAEAEQMARAWERFGPVTIGGPAYDDFGGDFESGLYLKPGYTITSRGCPNNCWFCSVPRREGRLIRELPIRDGWIVQDNNLLACSRQHVEDVFEMLRRQRIRATFAGGIEADLLEDWHVNLLASLSPRPNVFVAYDGPDDLESIVSAGKRLETAGFTRQSHALRCYVLIGYSGDSMDAAERRLREAWAAGFLPMAMLWRGKDGIIDPDWRTFQRHWARPASVAAMCGKRRIES